MRTRVAVFEGSIEAGSGDPCFARSQRGWNRSGPVLPDGVDRFDPHDVEVGDAAVVLRFTRNKTGSAVAVLGNPGGVTVKALP